MDPLSIDERKKQAFRLFEQGDFQGSYALCRDLAPGVADPAISILCATNLFRMGRLDEAEAYFRDLANSLPGSSHVHSYLGRILEEKGDERALAEYAKAVALDPENLEALRCYASFLLLTGDPARAVPVLRHLVSRSGRPDDSRLLFSALRQSGMHDEALLVWDSLSSRGFPVDGEYFELLAACGDNAGLISAARAEFERTGDIRYAQHYLAALGRNDPGAASVEFQRVLAIHDDPMIRSDYVRMLCGRGEWAAALRELGPLLTSSRIDPRNLLLECEILAELDDRALAESHYKRLIDRELESLADMEFLSLLLECYCAFLRTHYPLREAERLLKEKVSSNTTPACLLAVASFYEEIGDSTEARSYYYRAYRSDFLAGGPAYAGFCERQGDIRECEKVMLYVIQSIRKSQDLIKVGEILMGDPQALHHMPRLLERFRERLEEKSEGLSSRGLELLALALRISGEAALQAGDYSQCKRFCLQGLDFLPPGSTRVHPEEFLAVLEEGKRRSLCDLPVLPGQKAPAKTGERERLAPEQKLDLDRQELAIVEFLKMHHEASEMDLRLLIGTRRVVGIVNRIIQKAAAHGLILIEKRGVGKDGEIYAYKRA